jgi:hypothetical protein
MSEFGESRAGVTRSRTDDVGDGEVEPRPHINSIGLRCTTTSTYDKASSELISSFINLAGVFWKRSVDSLPPLPPPSSGPPSPPPLPAITMSRTPEQPRLTPQFCFNQTALRGTSRLCRSQPRAHTYAKPTRLPPDLPRDRRRHHLPKPERTRHTRDIFVLRPVFHHPASATAGLPTPDRAGRMHTVQRPGPVPIMAGAIGRSQLLCWGRDVTRSRRSGCHGAADGGSEGARADRGRAAGSVQCKVLPT